MLLANKHVVQRITFPNRASMVFLQAAVRHRRFFSGRPIEPITFDGNYSLRFSFTRLRSFFSSRLRCCSSNRSLSLSLALSTVLSHSSLSLKQCVWQPTLSSNGSIWQLAVQAISLLEQSN